MKSLTLALRCFAVTILLLCTTAALISIAEAAAAQDEEILQRE